MPETTTIHPGLILLRGFLVFPEQQAVARRCRDLAAAPAGAYTPTVRGGGRMRLSMVCLGRHWNPLTYRYEDRRSDYDDRPVQPLPADLAALARRAATTAGMTIEPDICIINLYTSAGRLGLHQDKDERPETLASGIPIVSLSVGATARLQIGGFRRRDSVQTILVHSGDAIVMGGASRLRYHGVSSIVAGTAPTGLDLDGRINLTFRQY